MRQNNSFVRRILQEDDEVLKQILKEAIEDYLNTRRAGWPYDGRYVVRTFGENGFVAMIDDNVAGMA